MKREEDEKTGMNVRKTPLAPEEVEGEMTCDTLRDRKMVMKRDVETEMEKYNRYEENRIPTDEEYVNF